MALINEYYFELPKVLDASKTEKEVGIFKVIHPSSRLINLGWNEKRHPLDKFTIEAMHQSVDEIAMHPLLLENAFQQGHLLLREAIQN